MACQLVGSAIGLAVLARDGLPDGMIEMTAVPRCTAVRLTACSKIGCRGILSNIDWQWLMRSTWSRQCQSCIQCMQDVC